jgi:hypothetical protein
VVREVVIGLPAALEKVEWKVVSGRVLLWCKSLDRECLGICGHHVGRDRDNIPTLGKHSRS